MNLSEFNNHQVNCPVCNKYLYCKLQSTRKYKYRIITFPETKITCWVYSTNIRSINKSSNFDIDLILNPHDNSFCVDYYDRSLKKMDYVPKSFMNAFREFDKNQKDLFLEKGCGNCWQYGYSSGPFQLNYNTKIIDNLSIGREALCIYKEIDDSYTKVYKVVSENDCSTIFVKEANSKSLEDMYPFTGMHMDFKNSVKIQNRLSVLEISIDKLETLLTFS